MIKKIKNEIPNHVALILDGNGRWATKRHLARSVGHRAGMKAVKAAVSAANDFGIKFLSLFAFSTENWKRDKEEVDYIFDLFLQYLNNDSSYYLNNNIKLVTSGDISKLPKEIFEKLEDLKEKSKNNSGLCVNLCLNYGGRDEILMAINLLLKEKKDNISLDEFKNCLYTASLPDPDLVIRTSGECRLSNFMLFQVAYSELYCPKVLWPDFGKRHFKKAIIEFQKRDRRFGAIKKS